MNPTDRAPDVLEANLERLFARAYEPVQPTAEFRRRLRLALERELLRPRAARRSTAWRVAAAILLLIGGALLGWAIFGRASAPAGVEELHAGSAEKEGPQGAEKPLTEPEVVDGAVLGDSGTETPARTPEGASSQPVGGSEVTAAAPTTAVFRGSLALPEGFETPESFEVTLLRAERLPEVSEPHAKTFSGDSFVFEDLEPGTWSVFVHVPGCAAFVRRGVELAAGATVDLRCALGAGIALRGRVLDAEGSPVEGALVLVEEDTPMQVLDLAMEEAPPSWPAAVRSDAEGAFELPHLLPGRRTLRATRAGHGAGWVGGIDPAAVDPADPRGGVEIRLTRAGAIEGAVAHDDGAPWPGAVVIVSNIDMAFGSGCMSYGMAVAGAEGRYAVEDLPPGSYVVFNALEGRGRGGPASPRIVQARVEEGARLHLDLPGSLRGTSVEGRLLSENGEAIAGLDLTFVPVGAGDEDWKAARSGDDGGFRFPDLAPGPYDVFVGPDLGVHLVRQARIEVPMAPVFRPTITVAAGSLRGRVAAAATGAGLPRSAVVVEIELEGELIFAGRTQADARGDYELQRLPPGRYRATAYAISGLYGQETIEDVDIPRDPPTKPLDFALQPGSLLSIRVADASGRPVAGAAIEFIPASGAAVGMSPRDATDAKGSFVTPGMKPGRWTIRASHPTAGRAEVAVDLGAGEERRLDIALVSDR